LSWACPYCGNPQATPEMCGHCERNPSAPRRVCKTCKMMTPKDEGACWHCGTVFTNELSWKIPVVILVIVVSAFVQFFLRDIH
jgi:RNA polymerase subunit RPABC4/transcription elongation factor Spt4